MTLASNGFQRQGVPTLMFYGQDALSEQKVLLKLQWLEQQIIKATNSTQKFTFIFLKKLKKLQEKFKKLLYSCN